MRWRHDARVWIALSLLAVTGVASLRSLEPPAALPADAPADVYSAGRARVLLADLLGNQAPHPVGSVTNRAVRVRLVQALADLGIEADVQRTVGCSARGATCARLENVIAELPGATRDAIALMAHYDSVPHAPGAADDGSGVVTLLESARLLLREPPGRNRVLLVFTDAEEVGLLGAEAFFAEHPHAADVKAVVNIEGSGSGGPSWLLRTTDDGGRLVDAFREVASAPTAVSVAQEIFRRMPNDTDFSVAERAGIAAIDFAFGFEFNHYHTPLDTLENLDPRSLQHHGENVYPLVRALRDRALDERAESYAYMTLDQRVWVTWPKAWSVPLALLGLAGILVAALRLRRDATPGAVLGAFAAALAVIVLSAAATAGALWVAGAIAGTTVRFPADPWPWRLVYYASPGVAVSLVGWWATGRFGASALFLGVWGLVALLALVLAWFAPLAANLLLLAVLASAVVGGVLCFASPERRNGVVTAGSIVCLLVLGYTLLGVVYANEQTQGLRLAPAIYAGLLLLAAALLPLLPGRTFLALALACVAGGWIYAATADLYSTSRPQHVSILYLLDRDSGDARYGVDSDNPLPARLLEQGGMHTESLPFPWSTRARLTFVAPVLELPASSLEVRRDGALVEAVYRAGAGEDFFSLVIPATAGITDISIEGRSVPVREIDGFVELTLIAPGPEPVRLGFRTESHDPVQAYLVDGAWRLPAFARPLAQARGELAVPQHQGDRRLLWRRVDL